MSHAWRQGELRTFAGSSGLGLSQYGLKGIPFLTGTITCEYYDDGGSTIYVTCTILSQYPELVRTAGDWISKQKQESQSNATGIINGDLSQERTDKWGKVGWTIEGWASKGPGIVTLYRWEYGSTLRQKITVGSDQGVSFKVKATGVKMEVLFKNQVIYSADYTSGVDWTNLIVPFLDNIGEGELSFYVLPGSTDKGAYASYESISLVEIT